MTTFAAALAVERPDEIAVRDQNSALSWAEVDDVLNRAVNGLLELDLGPDRRMAVFAENAVETGLEMAYRDARITKIYEGTNDVNRMLSVGELTKRGLKTKEELRTLRMTKPSEYKGVPEWILTHLLSQCIAL